MCTIFAVKTDSGTLVGRNFDWLQSGGTIHFVPSQRIYGQKTFGLFLIEQMGADRPYEGLNEKGLFIGCAVTPIDLNPPSDKTDDSLKFDELGIMRFILERASNVQEAIKLMDNVGLRNSFLDYYIRLHYLIADSAGNVVFYQSGVNAIEQVLSNGEGDVITNFPRSINVGNCWRYNTVSLKISSVKSMESAMNLLGIVKQNITIWSSVYNLSERSVWTCIENDYKNIHKFSLDKVREGYSSFDFATLRIPLLDIREQVRQHLYQPA
jgi:penicillin V acylase-like amidase (Ntn superfamily)